MCQSTREPTTHIITAVNKIDMMEIIPVTYTSLRDLLTVTDVTSPRRMGTEHNISIKNPLVKQAALAYLSPKSTPPDIEHHCLGRQCSCVDFVNGVFDPIKQAWFNVFGSPRWVRAGCEKSKEMLHHQGKSQGSRIYTEVSSLSLENYEVLS